MHQLSQHSLWGTWQSRPQPNNFVKIATHTHNRFMALWNLSGTTRVSRYQKKHSLTHTHRGHQSSLSAFSIYYDPWYPPYSIHMLYSLFPQSLSKFCLVYLLAWYPSTSYSIHFFTQSLSSFHSTWPYDRNLFCCSTEIMSSNSSLPLNSSLGTLSCNFTPTNTNIRIFVEPFVNADTGSLVYGWNFNSPMV